MNKLLFEIIDKVRIKIDEHKAVLPLKELQEKIKSLPSTRDFGGAFKDKNTINLMAEVKKASPSAGIIVEDYRPVEIAKVYEREGIKTISVLTEEDFFQGSLEDLKAVKENTKLPVLRKDFIVDEYQLYEARYFGADAILLIVRILEVSQLRKFLKVAEELGLASLVETHNREELNIALSAEAKIIGINNRNLDTLSIDINRSLELFPLIPEDKIVISESGIKGKEEIKQLYQRGINNFLVGEALLKSPDLKSKLRELLAEIQR